jgi:hypothetical protein
VSARCRACDRELELAELLAPCACGSLDVSHVPFDRSRFLAHARTVNPALRAFELSATRRRGGDRPLR